MGVYIKGLEMPKSCWDCYFQDCGNCRLKDHKVVDKCIIEDRIDEDCPLVPVPPHGRCVDADKLMQEMRLFVKENMLSRDDARELLETIEGAPTIIPAEEGE